MWRRNGNGEVVEQVEEYQPASSAAMWSPAQIVALIIGAASLIFGLIALANTGIHPRALPGPRTEVAGFHHTQLLAYCEIVFGLLMVMAGAAPLAGRALMIPLCALALTFGIIVAIEAAPGTLHHWLSVHERNGWLFIAAGGLGLVAALFFPVFGTGYGRRRVVRERRYVDEPPSHVQVRDRERMSA
jgi:uncharacterized membrane protein HdeD (DUF308 family)